MGEENAHNKKGGKEKSHRIDNINGSDIQNVTHGREEIDISALLTPKQRDYLQTRYRRRGNIPEEPLIEPGSAEERTIRSRIRDRFARSLADFTILSNHLEYRDLKQVFERPYAWGAINNVLEVIITGDFETTPPDEFRASRSEYSDTEALEIRLERALEHYYNIKVKQGKGTNDYRNGGKSIKIDVSINTSEGRTAKEIAAEIERNDKKLESITNEELDTLYEAGFIDRDEYMQLRGVNLQ